MNLPRGRYTRLSFALLLIAAIALIAKTVRDPNFWFGEDLLGDRLMAQKHYKEAAKVYTDPWRAGVALYRNGDFKEAASSFARVPGANGAFDQGNALLMHGAYDDAIKSYDRALGFHPNWQRAEENKALALARKKMLEDAGENRAEESADAYDPDNVTLDEQGENPKGKPTELNEVTLSDEALRAKWLRRVQTSPSDFLEAKFSFQAAHNEAADPDQSAAAEVDQ